VQKEKQRAPLLRGLTARNQTSHVSAKEFGLEGAEHGGSGKGRATCNRGKREGLVLLKRLEERRTAVVQMGGTHLLLLQPEEGRVKSPASGKFREGKVLDLGTAQSTGPWRRSALLYEKGSSTQGKKD